MSKTIFNFIAALIISLLIPFVPVNASPILGCNDTNRVILPVTPALSGYDVRELQERLLELGYLNSFSSGVYNEETVKAVKKLQADNNLPVDGVVTPQTWDAMAKGVRSMTTGEERNPPENPVLIIDVSRATLTVFSNGLSYHTFPVAVGKPETPSPIGEWQIIEKSSNWGGGFGTRWLGLNVPWGIYGIHGTNKPWSIGREASGGCFRMYNTHVEQLFRWISLETPVRVIGRQHAPLRRALKPGSSGPDVVTLQNLLREKGVFIFGSTDGRYGIMTAMAVRYFQFLNNLPPTGEADEATINILAARASS